MAESGVRVKFKLNRLGAPKAVWENWQELAFTLKCLENMGCIPLLPDGLMAGNIALRLRDNLLVSRSGRKPGELDAEDFVEVVDFDPETWEASYYSLGREFKPTSDTPLHWLALMQAPADLRWQRRPWVSLHGHRFATETEARALSLPISPELTEFSTPQDSDALLELMRACPYPQDSVYIRRGHGFFVVAQNFPEGLARIRELVMRAESDLIRTLSPS